MPKAAAKLAACSTTKQPELDGQAGIVQLLTSLLSRHEFVVGFFPSVQADIGDILQFIDDNLGLSNPICSFR
jgi:hypothetical protein